MVWKKWMNVLAIIRVVVRLNLCESLCVVLPLREMSSHGIASSVLKTVQLKEKNTYDTPPVSITLRKTPEPASETWLSLSIRLSILILKTEFQVSIRTQHQLLSVDSNFQLLSLILFLTLLSRNVLCCSSNEKMFVRYDRSQVWQRGAQIYGSNVTIDCWHKNTRNRLPRLRSSQSKMHFNIATARKQTGKH